MCDAPDPLSYLVPLPAAPIVALCDRLAEQIPASEYLIGLELLTFRERCTPWDGRRLADALRDAKRPDLAEQVEALLPMDVPSGMMFFIDPPPPPPSHPAARDLLAKLAEQHDLEMPLRPVPEGRWRLKWLRAVLGLAKRSRPS